MNPVEALAAWRGRRSHYALQQTKGAYFPEPGEITRSVLASHIAGEVTVGQYQIDEFDEVHWLCADLEHPQYAAQELAWALDFLSGLGLKPLVEVSSPGRYHVWLLLSGALPAAIAYEFGLQFKAHLYQASKPMVLRDYPDPEVQKTELRHLRNREFFPKQPTKGENGFGNLVRLPLGVHQRKRVRSEIPELEAIGQRMNSPMRIQSTLRALRLSIPDVHEVMRESDPERNIADRPMRISDPKKREGLRARFERIDASITMGSVVSHVLGIPPVKPGEKIVCPFHRKGDNGSSGTASFQVGGRIAKDVAWCWSTNCRLFGKKLTRAKFVAEYYQTEDWGEVASILESYL